MKNESLSKQGLEKLEKMPRANKVKLFHRLRIIELNKIISHILTNAVGNEDVRKTKAKIIHQLYDGNFKKDEKYNELQSVLESGKNFYDQLDVYTTVAYANYYASFVRNAGNVHNYVGVESAMRKAFDEIQACVRTTELNITSNQKAMPSSLLQAKYRKAVIDFLEKELKIQFNINDTIILDGQLSEIEEEEIYKELASSSKSHPPRDIRNLEKYVSANGEVYYLDADGECYILDDVSVEP